MLKSAEEATKNISNSNNKMKKTVLKEAINLMKDKSTPDSSIMTYLIRHETDWDQKTVDTPDKKGITLLMYASAYGKEQTVKYLLSKGANPAVMYTNKKSGTTHSPSQMAAANKHPKIVKMLDVAKNRMQQKSIDAGKAAANAMVRHMTKPKKSVIVISSDDEEEESGIDMKHTDDESEVMDIKPLRRTKSAMSSDKFKSLVEGLSEADAQSVADCLHSRASTKSRVSSSASTKSRRTTNSERSAKRGQRQPSLRDLMSEETDVQSMRTPPRSSRSRRSSGSSITHILETPPKKSRSRRSSGSSVSTHISRVSETPRSTMGSLRLSLSPSVASRTSRRSRN